MNLADKRILVTGGNGFLGKHVVGRVAGSVVAPDEFDLCDADCVRDNFDIAKPDVVVHLAARCGGIGANRASPAEFVDDNLTMGLNVIRWCANRKRAIVLVGTCCSYPADTPTPFSEDDLWNGYPEPTNAPYGIAKRTLGEVLMAYHRQYGLKGAYPILANLYGPGDNFDLETSHVIPAMIRKFCEAKQEGSGVVVLWGTGTPTREFLYVEDAADAIVRCAERVGEPAPINIGTGLSISMRDLASLIAKLVGFKGQVLWDSSKPDGQRRRRLRVGRAERLLDWRASTGLEDGLQRTIEWWRKEGCKRYAAASA